MFNRYLFHFQNNSHKERRGLTSSMKSRGSASTFTPEIDIILSRLTGLLGTDTRVLLLTAVRLLLLIELIFRKVRGDILALLLRRRQRQRQQLHNRNLRLPTRP